MRAEIWFDCILSPQFLEQWLVCSRFSVCVYEMNEYCFIFNNFKAKKENPLDDWSKVDESQNYNQVPMVGFL